MKIAILGDLHIGMRKDSLKFHKHAEKFYSNVFFPYLKENKIDTVIQLGDLFDNRKSINPLSVDESKRYFFSHFLSKELKMYTLLGNHDIYWRESLKVNTPSQVIGEEYNIVIVDKPSTIVLDNTPIDLIPWMCEENREACLSFMDSSCSDICMGHFEISGFPMYRGMDSHDGMDCNVFRQYSTVLSGHFHTQSAGGNIQYVGTPYEITWEDYADPRGFHVMDTETGKILFVPNPHTIFQVVEYDSKKTKVDFDSLSEKIVKVVVKSKDNLYEFEHFINRVNSSGAYDVKIVDTESPTCGGEFDENINLADTMSILSSYIDSLDISNKSEIKAYMRLLYTEALNIEVV